MQKTNEYLVLTGRKPSGKSRAKRLCKNATVAIGDSRAVPKYSPDPYGKYPITSPPSPDKVPPIPSDDPPPSVVGDIPDSRIDAL